MSAHRSRSQIRRALERIPAPIRRFATVPAWRAREHRLALKADDAKSVGLIERERGEWPLPPAKHRVKVVATADPAYFLRSGKAQIELIADMLGRNDVALTASDSALDFGCGCGRMARWWPTVSGARLHGCDYNSELVTWAHENLPFLETRVNELKPPLPYADNAFDFIYALSVFTHLPQELEHAWLIELRRVLAPGGHLFFSVSGSGFTDRLTSEERRRFEAGEAIVHFAEGAGSNLCATYHPPAYVQAQMLDGYKQVAFTQPELQTDGSFRGPLRQDGYLLRCL